MRPADQNLSRVCTDASVELCPRSRIRESGRGIPTVRMIYSGMLGPQTRWIILTFIALMIVLGLSTFLYLAQ
jgi:hypothetical protein